MLLSLLIPTIPKRTAYLNRLLTALAPQVIPGIEVIIEMDAAEKSIGMKRNGMLRKASGEFVAFCDDDDFVTPDYIAELMVGIKQGVDVTCIQQRFFQNGEEKGIVIDKPGQQWNTVVRDGQMTFLRGVQHLDCIRREIAMSVEYQDKKFGEDFSWSADIEKTGLIKTWHLVDHPVYLYDYKTNKDR